MANIKDFATSLIATAPSPANSGTSLVLDAGMGARMPATPFAATIHPEGEIPTLDNAEKVNVTNVVVDTLTIQRAQGDTTAKSIAAGWRLSNAIFASDLDLSTYQLKPIEGAFVNGDKTKLDGIAAGAQVNTVTSVSGKTGAVTLDKTDVGLSNVDNTSDANKPVSTATQTALNSKVSSTSTGSSIYATNGSGVDTPILYSTSPTAMSIAMRENSGVLNTGTPTANGHATTKLYVDAADALKVNKAGDTMTGRLIVNNPTNPDNYADFLYSGSSNYAIMRFGNLRTAATDTISTLASVANDSGGTAQTFGSLQVIARDVTAGNRASSLALNRYSGNVSVTALELSNSTFAKIAYPELRFANNERIVYGSGFPNGSVSAPVGSIYIDTAVTNGASSWIKKSGTGNTGWSVLEGDTGWRDVTSLATGVTSGNIYYRRYGNMCTINFSDVVAGTSSGNIVYMVHPSGFAPDRTVNIAGLYSGVFKRVLASGSQIQAYAVASGDAASVTISYYASAFSYPSTLPGTAA